MKLLQLFAMMSIVLSSSVWAQAGAQQKMEHSEKKATPAVQADAAQMTDGEVRKINKEQGKLTLRHGEIKNLDMPGMTMVFRVRDKAMLDQVAVGDKVKFSAEHGEQGLTVTELKKQ